MNTLALYYRWNKGFASYEGSSKLIEGLLLVSKLEGEVKALPARALGQDERQNVLVRYNVATSEVDYSIWIE